MVLIVHIFFLSFRSSLPSGQVLSHPCPLAYFHYSPTPKPNTITKKYQPSTNTAKRHMSPLTNPSIHPFRPKFSFPKHTLPQQSPPFLPYSNLSSFARFNFLPINQNVPFPFRLHDSQLPHRVVYSRRQSSSTWLSSLKLIPNLLSSLYLS